MSSAEPAVDAPLLKRELRSLVTFDRGVRAIEPVVRPDRYRTLGTVARDQFAVRGGGYSYAAASFGDGATVIDMRRFDRVLAFDTALGVMTVEAGMTVGDLLALAGREGWWLPVMPGYPAITIGGCVAANVHGKNPGRAGTFRRLVRRLTLQHPAHGTVTLDAGGDRSVLDLTLGGYGLTGVIQTVTLQLERLPGPRLTFTREAVASLDEGLQRVSRTPPDAAFYYTWHDGAPGARFGRGLGYHGAFVTGAIRTEDLSRPYRRLDTGRARLPVSVWNPWLTPIGNWGYYWAERAQPATGELGVFESCFPFARSPAIFKLFGRPGFIEYQALVSAESAPEYVRRVTALLQSGRYPSVLVSMKWFAGEQRYLRFERSGACITVYLTRTASGLDAARKLDEVLVDVGGLPNIVKDSRLPLEVVRSSYEDYDGFRDALRSWDPRAAVRSELRARLAL